LTHQSTAFFLQNANRNFSDLLIIIQERIQCVGYQQSK